LPPFIVVDGDKVTVAPISPDHIGVYHLKGALKTSEGKDNQGVEFPGGVSTTFDNLKLTVTGPPIIENSELSVIETPIIVEDHDPCTDTNVIAVQEPKDMEVVVGNSQATQQL